MATEEAAEEMWGVFHVIRHQDGREEEVMTTKITGVPPMTPAEEI